MTEWLDSWWYAQVPWWLSFLVVFAAISGWLKYVTQISEDGHGKNIGDYWYTKAQREKEERKSLADRVATMNEGMGNERKKALMLHRYLPPALFPEMAEELGLKTEEVAMIVHLAKLTYPLPPHRAARLESYYAEQVAFTPTSVSRKKRQVEIS